jgi:hypothetical protein
MHGGFERMVPVLHRNEVAAVMFNYRTAALGPAERQFLGTHFTHYWGNLYLPGTDLSRLAAGSSLAFEVLKPRAFRYEGSGAISIDGTPFTSGALARGVHAIRADRAAPGRLIIDTPGPPPAPLSPQELYVNFD